MRRIALLAAAFATAASGALAQGYGQSYDPQTYPQSAPRTDGYRSDGASRPPGGGYDSGGYSSGAYDRSGSAQPSPQGGYSSGAYDRSGSAQPSPQGDYQQPYGGQGGYAQPGSAPARDTYGRSSYDAPRDQYGAGDQPAYQGQGGYPQQGYPRSGYARQPYPSRDAGTDYARSSTGGSLGSIFSCDASGGKQGGGALLGGVVGGLAGNALSRGNRTLGTAIGAAVGAATGSYIGCKMQRQDVNRASYATQQALTSNRAQTWTSPETGAYGRVNVYADSPTYAQNYGGRGCRIVDQTFTTRSGGSQTERYRACRAGSDWTYTRL